MRVDCELTLLVFFCCLLYLILIDITDCVIIFNEFHFVVVFVGLGVPATVMMYNTELHLDWRNVFIVHRDVTFSVFAGTSEGYGDIINHVTTKTTSLSVHCTKKLFGIFVIIQATDSNGAFALYSARLQV